MRVYKGFSTIYDDLMQDVPYDQFASLFDRAVHYVGIPLGRVMDLGCGTGTMIPHLLRKARSVVGIDPSLDMLTVAAQKQVTTRNRVTFVQSTAADMPTEVRVDFCVSFCDVFNYIVTERELLQSFRAVARALSFNGHFLFDLHSPHKVLNLLGNQAHYDVTDDHVAFMQTSINDQELIVTYELTLFARTQNELYERMDENHQQRAYPLSIVLFTLAKAGFQSVHMGSDGDIALEATPVDLSHFGKLPPEEQQKEAKKLEQQYSLRSAERWFFFAHVES